MNALLNKKLVTAEKVNHYQCSRYFIKDELGFLGLLNHATGQMHMATSRGGMIMNIHKYSFKLLK
jgi:hypothetical protein